MRESDQTDVDRVCEAIYLAILERRLEPNTRLVETKLAEALGASRATVRQALLLMAQRRLVDIVITSYSIHYTKLYEGWQLQGLRG